MNVVRIVYELPDRAGTTYMRDPEKVGRFWTGVECNPWGVGVRDEGCSQEQVLWLREDRITEMQDLGEGVRA